MCTVSVIATDFLNRHPGFGGTQGDWPPVGRFEFEALKREVVELRELLAAAKKFDAATGQPDCEDEGKMAILRRLAGMLGVEVDDAAWRAVR